METTWSVGELAAATGLTVRALHHYDEIGLLRPSLRSAAGYRSYTAADVTRLRQVLRWRELGFPLSQVAELVEESGDLDEALARQERLLRQRSARLTSLAHDVQREREARRMGVRLTREEQLAVFGDAPVAEWAAEAEERWGNSDAYAQSTRRTSRYTASDWARIRAESADLNARLARAFAEGLPAQGPAAMDLAEEHRGAISRDYYDCTYEIHRGLAEMYVADERFSAHYDAVAPGLARYLRDAILANAGRSGVCG